MQLSLFNVTSSKGYLVTILWHIPNVWNVPTCQIWNYVDSTLILSGVLILFGHADIKSENFFEWAPHLSTRDHKYKLYKKSSSPSVRYHFFLNVSSTYGIHYQMKLIFIQLKVLHVLLNVSRLMILSAISNVICFLLCIVFTMSTSMFYNYCVRRSTVSALCA